MAHARRLLMACVPFVLCACSGSGGMAIIPSDDAGDDARPAAPAAPPAIESLRAGWSTIVPGGATLCLDGSPYAFWVRPGKPGVNKVVVEFQGGGACGDLTSCSMLALATPDLGVTEAVDRTVAVPSGLRDHEDARNPFADWHHVIVANCTADQLLGDVDRTYGGELTYHHRGANDVRAVLDWLQAKLPSADRIFLTGWSGGAIPSLVWAPEVARRYPGAKLATLADAGPGALAEGLFSAFAAAWNAGPVLPSNAGAITNLVPLHRAVAAELPQMPIGILTTAFDRVNASSYAQLSSPGADAWAFSQAMRQNLAELETIPTFRSYLVPGAAHTTTPLPELYTVQWHDVRLAEWIGALASGALPASVDCGNACAGPFFGDLGASAEWRCLDETPVATPRWTPTISLVVRIVAPPKELDPAHAGELYAGLSVDAYDKEDSAATHPIAHGVTNAAGWTILSVATSAYGFDGFVRVSGRDAVPTRFYLAPPIADFAVLDDYVYWTVETRTSTAKRVAALELGADPTKSLIEVSNADCAGSLTLKSQVDLDGVLATAFYDVHRPWAQRMRTYWPLFVNVEPGRHVLRSIPDRTHAVAGSVVVHTAAGENVQILAVGPAH